MVENRKKKDIFTAFLILCLIGVDFILQGTFREYSILVIFIIWSLIDVKIDLNKVVFMIISFLLLISEVFLFFYKMGWFIQRTAIWVFTIFVFVIFSEVRKLKRSQD